MSKELLNATRKRLRRLHRFYVKEYQKNKNYYKKVLRIARDYLANIETDSLTTEETLQLKDWWDCDYRWDRYHIYSYPSTEESALQILWSCLFDGLVYDGPGLDVSFRDGLQSDPRSIVCAIESLACKIDDVDELSYYLQLWVIMINRYLVPELDNEIAYWEDCEIPEEDRETADERWSTKPLKEYVQMITETISSKQKLIEYKDKLKADKKAMEELRKARRL